MGATPIVFIALLHKYGISNNRPFGVPGKLNNRAFRCYIPHADALLNTEIYTAKVHMRLFSTFGDLRGHTRRGVECYSTDQGTAPHHEYELEMPRCHRGPRRFYPLLVYECVQ